MTGRVVILAGSPSDHEWVDKIARYLDDLGIANERRIGSALRVPEHVLELLRGYDRDELPTVFVTVAGPGDALSGLSDANVASPVISCPARSDEFAAHGVMPGLRTPAGVAPLVALEPANAALAAAKILGLHDPVARTAVAEHQRLQAQRILDADPGPIT